ncbi:hypothetical protein AMS68_003397 [Peltaster fructicola]|uniref:Phosphatidate cytidylyltransferase, mitochondrial n=1 Tax=Peltaster fructicola TaxID=286661 RepID=A0A6H0XTU8_9PEZI|nr:hypothetical protein AMS68_003397 [Peltaster fructicola]
MALHRLATFDSALNSVRICHRTSQHVLRSSATQSLAARRTNTSVLARNGRLAQYSRLHTRSFSSSVVVKEQKQQQPKVHEDAQSTQASAETSSSQGTAQETGNTRAELATETLPDGWEDDPDYNISSFSQLPHRYFGHNQHIRVNEEFKEALRQILWQFRAPIRYAFAYGSGVFGQKNSKPSTMDLSPHPHPPKAVEDWQKGGAKIIDFIFGVSHTQHWHSLNLTQYPEHYSGLRHLPNASAAISWLQDQTGAGVYFNPYITVNGIMIKYGVVNLDTLSTDLSEWSTLYLAGRLQKPVKILRDDARIRLANQVNLISALRTALLMLPEKFTERELYERIAGLSYMGDPRMNPYLASENPNKVKNIVGAQLPGFRQLYVPLIENLPNADFNDHRRPHEVGWEKEDAIRHTGSGADLSDVLGGLDGLSLQQDMDPVRRGNMVRRLPKAFRNKLYHQYKAKFGITGADFNELMQAAADEDNAEGFRRREAGDFERRIAGESDLPSVLSKTVSKTVAWPSTTQTIKSVLSAGVSRSWKYYGEKRKKGTQKAAPVTKKSE